MASVIMLIGLLGLAGLQVVGMRANNVGKRLAQASLLAQDLEENMQLWQYTDPRLTAGNNPGPFSDTNAAAITQYWNTGRGASPAVQFDYTDGNDTTGATHVNQLAINYEGVLSPVNPSLPLSEQTIFSRYWNVFPVDLKGTGAAQGKLVQVVVRWKEPGATTYYRQVTSSFFKYDPSEFNQ